VGDATGLWLAVTVLVFPGGGQPVISYDDVAGCVAGCGSERIGPKVQALCGVLIDPVGYVVFMLRRRTAVGPAEEVRVPQCSIADQIEDLHVVPVGVFELPDGCLVGRLLSKGNAGEERQQQGDRRSLRFQDGRPLTLVGIGWFDRLGFLGQETIRFFRASAVVMIDRGDVLLGKDARLRAC
jgi:hypothetical protein